MSTPLDPILRALQTTADVTSFQPTPEQVRSKSNFWTYFGTGEGSPLPANPDVALATRFGGDSRIRQWWDIPLFQDWFLNRDEFRQRMEYLANLATDQLEQILTRTSTSNSDKLSAIKLIMQLSRKSPDAQADTGDVGPGGAQIAKMNRVQLEEFIRTTLRLVPTEQIIDIPTKG